LTAAFIFDSVESAPVIERIVDVIVQRISEANIANASVVRPDREGRNISTSDGSIIVHQKQIVPNQNATHHGNPPAQAFDVLFHIQCFVRNQNEQENAYSSACNRVSADVIRALTNPPTDPALWYQFNGLAINARIGAQIPFTNDAGHHQGVILPLSVLYRVSENNHFEVRA
jgi:hypothetical protein